MVFSGQIAVLRRSDGEHMEKTPPVLGSDLQHLPWSSVVNPSPGFTDEGKNQGFYPQFLLKNRFEKVDLLWIIYVDKFSALLSGSDPAVCVIILQTFFTLYDCSYALLTVFYSSACHA